MKTCQKKAVTPLPLHLKLSAIEGEVFDNPELYRSVLGKLNFLTNTRPDLSSTVQLLNQFMHALTLPHYATLTHTLSYIANTAGQGIVFQGSDHLTLQAFSYSDWVACPDSRISVTGYVIMLGNSPITWKSKKQNRVSGSSLEAEYRAMASAASEVTWLVRLLAELGVSKLTPVTLHYDNQSAIHIAKNPVFHERTKHIEVNYFY